MGVIDNDYGPNEKIIGNAETEFHLNLSGIKKAVFVLVFVTVVLAICRELFLEVVGERSPLKALRQLDMDQENSLPTWLSSFLMTACAATAGGIAVLKRRQCQPFVNAFAMLGLVFLALSIDETASFHESLIDPLRTAFDMSGVLYFAWVIVGAPAAMLVFLVFLPMLRALGWYGVRLVFAGAVFVTGAVGFELLGGWLDSNGFRQSEAYAIGVLFEESLELVGLLLALFALLDYLAALWTMHFAADTGRCRPHGPTISQDRSQD
ncbi:MAG: hypothetical protein ACTS3R_09845 [Inquilinaceae bacterium]